jgi:FkbM family methyltransferase
MGDLMAKNRLLTKPLRYIGGRFQSLARYLDDPVLLAVKRAGVTINHVLPLMAPWIRSLPVKTIFDIGANTGQFAVAAAQIYPQAKMFSFEPLPDCYDQLICRLKKIPGAQAFNMGLGTDSGELEFSRSSASVSSSFLPMANAHKEAFPHSKDQVPVKVRVERLDTVAAGLELVDPILIKIDVQGYEDRVLKGGEELVRRARWIIVEVSFVQLYQGQPLFDDVYRWLWERGYRLHGFMDQICHPQSEEVLQADAFFIREG